MGGFGAFASLGRNRSLAIIKKESCWLVERRTVMYQGSGRGAAAVGTGCNAISLASSSDGRSRIEDELEGA